MARYSPAEATSDSFRVKWANNPRLLFGTQAMIESGSLNWIIERNGFRDLNEFRNWISCRKRILDAGCGNGRVTAVLRELAPIECEIVALDINPETASSNLAGLPNVSVAAGDLTGDLTPLGEFDLIYCQEVLHHTHDPRGAFAALASILSPSGELAVYVYKRKALLREMADDAVHQLVQSLDYDRAIAHMRDLAFLGRALSEIDVTVTVPGIEILGIEAGTYDLQRFLYHFFLKCYWNPALTIDENAAINFDWYHPPLSFRYSVEEVRDWFRDSELVVLSEVVDHYGITIRGLRDPSRG